MTAPGTPSLHSQSHFTAVYPDIDPRTPLPLSIWERISITTAVAVLAFGAAFGDVRIALVGAGLVIFALLSTSRHTLRKIRSEARARFPEQPWVENEMSSRLKLGWTMPLTWAVIMAVSLIVLWFVPAEYSLTGATTAGLLAAVLVWFSPGISPRWH